LGAAIDNEVYRREADIWWDENEPLSMLRTMMNPARVGFVREILNGQLGRNPRNLNVLDVGCGGGLLAEELAGLGLTVTGVDPALASVVTARDHARRSDFPIGYVAAPGESLPFGDGSFDAVVCTDVLEHVEDTGPVISEIARVLKDGGAFLFETINRTLRSRIALIGLFQTWKWSRCAPPNLHEWRRFIKPGELIVTLAQYGLLHRRTVGLQPHIGKFRSILEMLKRSRGKISYGELGRRMEMRPARDKSMSYMGWAVKMAKAT